MFTVPGSPLCLLSSQSVGLAGLAPRLICSKSQTEPSGGLNGQPTEGFSPECLRLVLRANICWGLSFRAAATPFDVSLYVTGERGDTLSAGGFAGSCTFLDSPHSREEAPWASLFGRGCSCGGIAPWGKCRASLKRNLEVKPEVPGGRSESCVRFQSKRVATPPCWAASV